MPLTMYVDGPRWRSHLQQVRDTHPGLVPVIKGNGYGFGVGRLASRRPGSASTRSRSGPTPRWPRSSRSSTAR